ncbi:MAG: hypothetical protein JRN38_05425 [Nitrososphaerota archaeon]|nr:hypothetical protein [Nitrososphaerota archaeon]
MLGGAMMGARGLLSLTSLAPPPLAPFPSMSAEMVSTRGAFAANEQQSRVPANDWSPYPSGRDYESLEEVNRVLEAREKADVDARRKGAASPAPEVAVLVRGDQRTFELRERLKAAGLQWLKEERIWSGSVPCEFVPQMEAEGLRVVPVVPEGHPLDRFTERQPPATSPKAPAHKPRSRPRREAPAKASAEERAAAFLPEHGWDVRDITANLADDDRAEDERRVERDLRDLRNRVKAVRAKVAADPTIQHTLATNPEKAAAFYAIHGVTAAQVRLGVPDVDVRGMGWEDMVAILSDFTPLEPVTVDWTGEEAQRAAATLPEAVA